MQGSAYFPVKHANNISTFQDTYHEVTGRHVKSNVARRFLEEKEKAGLLDEIIQYALLPKFIDDLQRLDPEVIILLKS